MEIYDGNIAWASLINSELEIPVVELMIIDDCMDN